VKRDPKKFLCDMFGHNFKICSNPDEIWKECKRCKIQENVSEQEELEYYRHLFHDPNFNFHK